MRIRKAVPSDSKQILRFIRDLAHYEKLSHEVTATEELLKKHLFDPNAAAEAIIAERDGVPVGFAIFYTSFSTFLAKPGLYLEDLFVLPEYRGQSFGKDMLSYLANEVVARAYGRLEWAVLDWNLPSIQFYESLGAKALADWITYRLTGEDLLRLARRAPRIDNK